MKWLQLHTFVTIVETGSFSEAAIKLKVSKAAVSQKLSQLESHLAVKLLDRTTRKIHLTDVGQTLYEGAKPLLLSLSELEGVVSKQAVLPEGPLRVMVPRYFAEKIIQPFLPKFMQKYPQIQISLFVEERFPDLKTEAIDLLIGVSLEGPEQLVRRKIFTTRYVLCASNEYLQEKGIPKRPQDLMQHRYITHSMRSPSNELHFKKNETLLLQPVLHVNDANIMLKMAEQGEGIIMLHDYMVEKAIEEGKLVEVLKNYNLGEFPVYVYFRQEKYMPTRIRAFLDFLYENIEKQT